MILTVTNEWPATLPLPSVDYNGAPYNSTLVSPIENAAIERRSRFTRSYCGVSVQWVFTDEEYQDFRAFVKGDLGNGAAVFKIELRFPKNTELTAWAVRFSAGFEADFDEGYWTVQATLETVNPIIF